MQSLDELNVPPLFPDSSHWQTLVSKPHPPMTRRGRPQRTSNLEMPCPARPSHRPFIDWDGAHGLPIPLHFLAPSFCYTEQLLLGVPSSDGVAPAVRLTTTYVLNLPDGCCASLGVTKSPRAEVEEGLDHTITN